VDGSGLLCWGRPHCDRCLVQRRDNTTLYMHQVLEAKLLGPAGVVLSIGSEFIENSDLADGSRSNLDQERVKQDCELKAFSRLAPRLKKRRIRNCRSFWPETACLHAAASFRWQPIMTGRTW
jgi:hypothetical protein